MQTSHFVTDGIKKYAQRKRFNKVNNVYHFIKDILL